MCHSPHLQYTDPQVLHLERVREISFFEPRQVWLVNSNLKRGTLQRGFPSLQETPTKELAKRSVGYPPPNVNWQVYRCQLVSCQMYKGGWAANFRGFDSGVRKIGAGQKLFIAVFQPWPFFSFSFAFPKCQQHVDSDNGWILISPVKKDWTTCASTSTQLWTSPMSPSTFYLITGTGPLHCFPYG